MIENVVDMRHILFVCRVFICSSFVAERSISGQNIGKRLGLLCLLYLHVNVIT